MEQEPRREPERYYVDYDNERYILGPENTLIYIHEDASTYDHIYIQFADNEDGEQQGTYMWRSDERYKDKFNMMVANLRSVNVTTITQLTASQFDIEQYHQRFGDEKPVEQAENAPEQQVDELDWISPRQERVIKNAVGFLIYLAEHDKL